MRSLLVALALALVAFALAAGCSLLPIREVPVNGDAGELPDLLAPRDAVPPSDSMVECGMESQCSGGLACRDNHCAPCSRHEECQSALCDVYAQTSKGPGACIPEAQIIYVDNKAGPPPNGTRLKPYTTIVDAITAAASGSFIKVAPSDKGAAYSMPSPGSNKSLRFYGPADPAAPAILQSGGNIGVGTATTTVIDGFDLISRVETTGGEFTLRRSRVYGTAGLSFTSTSVTLDSNQIRANNGPALYVFNGSTLTITNNMITGNTVTAGNKVIDIDNASGLVDFRFNTVASNSPGVTAIALACRGGMSFNIKIEDSIFMGNAATAGSQFQLNNCATKNLVVGMTGEAGYIQMDAQFIDSGKGDYRLISSAANRQCCINKAGGKIDHDIDHHLRPQGGGYDIGAHEAE